VGRYDGVEYVVKDQLTLPSFVARHLQNQSVVRDNPVTGEREYRLAVVEDEVQDPQEDIEVLPKESLDRSDLDPRHTKVEYLDLKNKPIPPAVRGSGRGDAPLLSK